MESILVNKYYTFKMLKYVLLNNNIGYIELCRIGLIYRLINYIIDNLEDFKID